MRGRFDLFGLLSDTIKADWLENIEALDKKLDEYIDAQRRANGFDQTSSFDLDYPVI